MVALLLLAGLAAGAERSLDTQLLHPSLDPGGGLLVGGARWDARGVTGVGLGTQWEHRPLEYLEGGDVLGAAIASRWSVEARAGLALGPRVALGAGISGARLDGDLGAAVGPAVPLALGDLDLGVRLALFRSRGVAGAVGLRAWLPVGTADAWVAEEAPRYEPSVVLAGTRGPATLRGALGLLVRPRTDSGLDFVLGTEATAALGLEVAVARPLSLLAEVGGRAGLPAFLQGGAENPALALGGLRLHLPGGLGLDLAGGTGLGPGYGTADLRALLAVTWRPVPRPPPLPEEVELGRVADVVDPIPVEAVFVPPPDPVDPLAWVERRRIRVREPIGFQPGTATLREDAQPVVEAVADLLATYPQVELLVVEAWARDVAGEAWDLSHRRAEALYRALVARGVQPGRVSFRGMGALPPVDGDPREVELRVERLRDWRDPAEEPAAETVVLPWSGEVVAAPPPGDGVLDPDAHPLLEQVPVEEGPDPLDPDIFREDEEEAP